VFPNGLSVIADVFTVEADGSTLEVMTDSAGNINRIATPGPNTPAANQQTIQTNVQANLATLQTWIAANPNGAVLTAAQTKVLARMLVGIYKLLAQDFANTTGT
jgi:hypothetical protein